MQELRITRRRCVQLAAASVGGLGAFALRGDDQPAAKPVRPKSVAAVVTVYTHKSHADVLVGKILEGWKQDGGPGPALKLAALYVDQFPARDLSRALAKKHGFPIFDTIAGTLTAGGNQIAVDGVLCIGEHGDYPLNSKGQQLYPRQRFMDEVCDTFKKHGRVVPVFNDKHLGPVWEQGKLMYDRAKALKVPYMAGSSLCVTYRDPDLEVPPGSDMEAAVGIGYGSLDAYGFHALEAYQCLVERRRGGETGVKSVQCLRGPALWKVVEQRVSPELLEAALARLPDRKGDAFRNDEASMLFAFDYADGFKGTLLMLPGYVGGTTAAVKLRGNPQPLATRFEERPEPCHPHFAYLLKGIERMIHTGQPSYPVERCLLTSGILDRALTSLADGQRKLMTPELEISYQPVAYPHAPMPMLLEAPV